MRSILRLSLARTRRLCLICLSVNIPLDVLAWLVKHLFLLWVLGTISAPTYQHVEELTSVRYGSRFLVQPHSGPGAGTERLRGGRPSATAPGGSVIT